MGLNGGSVATYSGKKKLDIAERDECKQVFLGLSFWLETWLIHLFTSMGPSEGIVAMDSVERVKYVNYRVES
jgi:hypothetical protein